MKLPYFRLCLAPLAGVLLTLPNAGFSASLTYTGASGKWSLASNWSPAVVPSNGDDVFLVQSGNKGISVNLVTPYSAPGLNSLLINGSGNGNMTLNSSKTFAVSGTEIIGSSGKGTFIQKNGAHTAGGMILGASGTTASGDFEIKKGSLTVASDLIVGSLGRGEFVQRAGNVTAGSDLVLGEQATAVGYYTQNNGTLTVAGSTMVGDQGAGSFKQTRGTSNHASLEVAVGADSEGLVTLTKGSMNSASAVIGNGGEGEFRHDNGTHTVQSNLVLGASLGGEGEYTLNAGTLEAESNVIVGQAGGSGKFTYSGGKMIVGGQVVVNAGSFTVGSATLETNGITVGAGATFVASGSGSRIRTTGDFLFGETATVNTSGAELVIARDADVTLSVTGDVQEGYAFQKLTLERDVVLTLDGSIGDALYVDVISLGSNNPFRLESIIIGNGTDIYYNATSEENAYLLGLRYDLGNGGQLIPRNKTPDASLAGSGSLVKVGAGSLTISAGASFEFGSTVLSGSYDLVTVEGLSSVLIDGALVPFDFLANEFNMDVGAWTIESYASGTLSESSSSSPTFGAVPEPSTWGLVLLGLVAMIFRRRFAVAR